MPVTISDTTITSSTANLRFSAAGFNYANLTSSGLIMNDFDGVMAYNFNDGALGGYRNKIINGKMDISQRGPSFTNPLGIFTLDRWVYSPSNSGAVSLTQDSTTVPSNEFQNNLSVTVTLADTSVAAGDYAAILQPIEGFLIRDLVGKTFTLSFWVYSNKTGVYGVSFRNADGTRSWVQAYTISSANVWEQKTITVIGGLTSTGSWNYSNALGLLLTFSLMTGTTFQTLSLGSWQTSNLVAPTTQVNFMDAVNNNFRITGVQLEIGDYRTSFEHRPYGIEFRMCQRYYQDVGTSGQNEFVYYQYNTSTSTFYTPYSFPVPMRVAPTPTVVGTWNFANLTAQPNGFSVSASYNAFRINVQPSAAGNIMLAQNSGSGSRITFNAELL